MINLIFAILCSLIVSINFKLFKRYDTNAYQAIVFNYPTAAIFCYFFLSPPITVLPTITEWNLFFTVAVFLISIFYFIGKSIATSGIVLTAIAQRISLIIPVLAAFLLFSEVITSVKIIGLAIGFAAIYLSKPRGKLDFKNLTNWYPIIVFLGTGILDILFNYLTKLPQITFTVALVFIFSIATVLGILSLIYQKIKGTLRLQPKAILAGMVLGLFNFGSIYFYIKALQIESNQPSIVFSSLDIGVISLSSIVGIILFKEKLSKLNLIGLALALIAIVILNLPNAL
jgi:drug/metabolite transporter (DMT)-like permease